MDSSGNKLPNRDEAEGRKPHWRFKLDQREIVWTDLVRGETRIDTSSLSDPVLIRGDGQVLYTMASVVDDTDMGVTHVVRGSDHVTNTATQIQIIRALGAEPPAFAHHSLLTGPQGEALSKRLGTLSLRDLRAARREEIGRGAFKQDLRGEQEPVAHDLDPLAVARTVGILAGLATVFFYLRLDTATRGYYSGRLQFATGVIILGLVSLGILVARWIPWL